MGRRTRKGGGLASFGSTFGPNLWNNISSAWTATKNVVGNLGGAAWMGGEKAYEAAGNVAGAANKMAGEAYLAAKEAPSYAAQAITGAAKSAGQAALNVASPVVKPVVGAVSKAADIANKVGFHGVAGLAGAAGGAYLANKLWTKQLKDEEEKQKSIYERASAIAGASKRGSGIGHKSKQSGGRRLGKGGNSEKLARPDTANYRLEHLHRAQGERVGGRVGGGRHNGHKQLVGGRRVGHHGIGRRALAKRR
jgi:hypothetical protein